MFNEEYVTSLIARYRTVPESTRPDVYYVATSPDREPARRWINEAVARLAEPGRSRMISRLRSDQFITAFHEVAVAAILQDAGFDPIYEPELVSGEVRVTPDFTLGSPPHTLIEVWSRGRHTEFKKDERAWRILGDRVREIPRPIAVVAERPSHPQIRPPTSRQAKVITHAIRDWLLSVSTEEGSILDVEGYRFRAASVSIPGIRAMFVPPARGGWVDSDVVIEAIRTKLSRYRDVVVAEGCRLVVVLAAEPAAPLSLDLVKDALAGKQTMAVSLSAFAPGGAIFDHSYQMRSEEVAEAFDPALSAVAWLETSPDAPGSLTLLPIQDAARTVDDLAAPLVELDRSLL